MSSEEIVYYIGTVEFGAPDKMSGKEMADALIAARILSA
jgi:hypothetical protein